MATPRRIMAEFFPEAWINDQAIRIDGDYEFDITDQVIAMGRQRSLAIEDNRDAADRLWETWLAAHPGVLRHHGPFSIHCHDAIEDYWAEA